MPTVAASGSGEPPEEIHYGDKATLPRSGLLEPAHPADRSTAPLRAAVARPLMGGVGRHANDLSAALIEAKNMKALSGQGYDVAASPNTGWVR